VALTAEAVALTAEDERKRVAVLASGGAVSTSSWTQASRAAPSHTGHGERALARRPAGGVRAASAGGCDRVRSALLHPRAALAGLAPISRNPKLPLLFSCPAAWMLPTGYAVMAAVGLGWAVVLRARRPQVYATTGLGAHAVTGQMAPAARRAAS
jgi:hypothetical protein